MMDHAMRELVAPEPEPTPRKEAIDYDADPDGPSFMEVAFTNWFDGALAYRIRDKIESKLSEKSIDHTSGSGNILKHRAASYVLDQIIGPDEAKKFGDAHERRSLSQEGGEGRNSIEDMITDLESNRYGRNRSAKDGELSLYKKFTNYFSPDELIEEAIEIILKDIENGKF